MACLLDFPGYGFISMVMNKRIRFIPSRLLFIFSILGFVCISVSGQVAIPSEEEFIQSIREGKIDQSIVRYNEIKQLYPDIVIFRRNILNNLGWELELEERLDEAIKVFELNIRAYPDHFTNFNALRF